MAINIDETLSKCGILEKLRLNSKKYNNVKDSKNLLAIFDQHIFVWHDAGSCILTAEMKSNQRHENIQKLTSANHLISAKENSFKTLTLTNPPVFEVDSLSFNQTGSLLAISGRLGITIYEVPWRYGKFGATSASNEVIIGRSWNIAEMFFICTNRVQIIQTAWHPGSTSKTHITVLCTDNYIRIYDVNDPQVPEQAISIGANAQSSYLSSESKISFSSCFGENAVSFDFGPPENMQVLKPSSSRSSKEYETRTACPIYLLHGNGDIYILKAPLKSHSNHKLEGPLAMYPPAEDNYGYDACAILCLHSTPTTLVIATATGMLYHCLVLENANKNLLHDQNLSSPLCDQPSDEWEESLYVFESVELPLTLTEDQDDDVFANPIRMYKDIISPCKYHCTHVSGLHSVAMPFLQALVESSGADSLKQVLSDQQMQPCIVEHILCTKPFSQMKSVPVLGLDCTVSDAGIILICLLASWEFVSFSILSSFLPPIPHLLSEESPHTNDKPLCSTFEQSLEKALQRSLCSPMVKSFPSDGSGTSPQQWLDLLCSVTQRFREDYIQRLTSAYALLRSRIKVLNQQKEYQLNDIKRCEQEKENLRRGVEHLAEKFEDAQAIQQNIQKRIENVLKKLQLHLPYLSKAEIEMKETLLGYEDKLKNFRGSLGQIEKKLKYQREKAEEIDKTSTEKDDLKKISFNETQMKHVKELLSQEGESISDVMKNVNLLKKQFGLG